MNDNSQLFNRILYRRRRARRAARWESANFLKQEAAARLGDSLLDVARRFPIALDLGCHRREVASAITTRADYILNADHVVDFYPDIVCDEELLPFAEASFDLVTSALSLHHVNDLPGTLIQIQRCLKPDGLFLAILPGANSLKELRSAVTEASALHGFALSPRLSPLVEIRDAGALLQRAGFALPVVDSDSITVEYESVGKLFEDLQAMGESNVLHAQQRGLTSRSHLAAIVACYEQRYGTGGVIPATFEFLTLTGWKPHASQQRPAPRGSGTVGLKQVL